MTEPLLAAPSRLQVMPGAIAPLAGVGGEHTAIPMALLTTGCMAVSMAGLLVLARPEHRSQHPRQSP